MERIQSVNIERIQWACHQFGITPYELATKAGIPESAIERLLNGDGTTFNYLQKIAEFLGHGVLFFVEQGPVDEATAYTPQFRTILNRKPNLSAKLRKFVRRVEKQREVYIALQEAISEPAINFTPPVLTGNGHNSEIVREWLGLRTNNPLFSHRFDFDIYREMVEDKGVLVILSNGYNGKWQMPKNDPILGFSIYHEFYPVIVVKKQSDQRQVFTLMHELAHLLIHKTSWVDDEHDLDSYVAQERDASALAGRVLVPDVVLARLRDQDKPSNPADFDIWLDRERRALGVSGEVILRRLLDSGRLYQEEYTAYREWKDSGDWDQQEGGFRLYRHREPVHIFGDKFVRTVFEALQAKEITLVKASTYLDNLKIHDVHALEQYCYANV
ncbi:MAG: XRE family transcriptional regulator [Chloroflexi bacterium]|nr:XRE family transcriptional regulator [Chloroflexota bacterium]